MPAPHDILGLTSAELAERTRQVLPTGRGLAMRLYPRAFRGEFAPESFPVSAASAAAWRAHFRVGLLEVVRVVAEDGALGATAKAVLRTADGHEIECVRIPMRGDRREAGSEADDGGAGKRPRCRQSFTLCLSSQIGCRMGCAFCETARMGFIRDLTAAEIVAQVVTVGSALGWKARNLVFMGMGEPLDNADALIQALRVLGDQRGLHYSQERLTVCTAGHAEGLAALAALGWKRLNLSLSLNAADDAARTRLMPINRRTGLAELQRLLAAYPQRRNFTLGVNYCLLPGRNDTREDSRRVADFCRPLGRVLVNLIPYNPGSNAIALAPTEAEIVRFVEWLREDGLPVRRRITKGRSIMAGCGQLAGR
jgi:23S rRNA (adenine2503-C2)-methyltransferase